MTTHRTARAAGRRARRKAVAPAARKSTLAAKVASQREGKAAARAVAKPAPLPQQVLYRMCRPGWSVVVEKTATGLGTRFVCPFCPLSHRVLGPVRGFRKVRRAQWVKLRRVAE